MTKSMRYNDLQIEDANDDDVVEPLLLRAWVLLKELHNTRKTISQLPLSKIDPCQVKIVLQSTWAHCSNLTPFHSMNQEEANF